MPCCTISRIKWYQPSTCLDRSWNTGFYDKQIPLRLSQRITVASSTCSNNSLKSFRNQVTSQQAIHVIMYSASTVLKAIDFSFLPEADLRVKQHLDALLRSTTTSPIDISISMKCHTLGSVSQPMVFRASEISQEFLGTNSVNVMINHVLTQSFHCTTYVQTGVH